MPHDPSASASEQPTSASADEASVAAIPIDQDAPFSLLLAIIVLLLLLVAAGFHVARQSPVAQHLLGEPATSVGAGPITDVTAIVREEVGRNLLGRDVSLWDVTVVHVPGDYVFWISAAGSTPVAVVLMGEQTGRQSEGERRVRVGDRLAVFGTIRAAREVQLLDETWSMTPAEWQRLDREAVYISALRVEQIQPTDRS